MSDVKISLFKSDKLNKLTEKLVDLDNQYTEFMQRAERNIHSAFKTRWLYGKYISENYDEIINECGTQKEFANKARKSEAVISNNKRAYENLLENGCETFDDVKALLNRKQIKPTISNFEKIGTLLNEPKEDTKQKEQIPKDRKRLEELMEELGDIIKRNESGNNIDIAVDASELLDDVKNIKHYIEGFDPYNNNFNSEKYLNFIRNFGFDVLTMKPIERCDPHHVALGSGKRQNDILTIPVSRKTHVDLHLGLTKLSEAETKDALIYTMATFINKVL